MHSPAADDVVLVLLAATLFVFVAGLAVAIVWDHYLLKGFAQLIEPHGRSGRLALVVG